MPQWLEGLLDLADSLMAKDTPANRTRESAEDRYRRYCRERNLRFRSYFGSGTVPGADLQFQRVRNANGQPLGVVAAFVLPPFIYAGASFCNPQEPFDFESGFYKATRLPEELQRLGCPGRRGACLVAELQEPADWRFMSTIAGGVRSYELERDGVKETRERVLLPAGVDWLVGGKRMSYGRGRCRRDEYYLPVPPWLSLGPEPAAPTRLDAIRAAFRRFGTICRVPPNDLLDSLRPEVAGVLECVGASVLTLEQLRSEQLQHGHVIELYAQPIVERQLTLLHSRYRKRQRPQAKKSTDPAAVPASV